MSILWITENYSPNSGGMAHSCDRIVSNIRQQGVHVDVVHLARKCRRRPRGNPIVGEDHCWSLGDAPSHGLNLLWNWLEPRANRYRKIVAFGTHYALIAAHNYSAWLNIPLVTCVRGNDFDTAVFDARRRVLIDGVYSSSEHVVCVSQDKVSKIQRLFPKVSASCVPNGIDLNHWRASSSLKNQAHVVREKTPSGKRVIGLIGDLKAKKGGAFFFETLILSGLADKLHIMMVGTLEEGMSRYLDEHQGTLSYTHIPFVDRHQLIPYYLACDCLAIPSFYDGMPNVLLEAGGLGVPILAADTGGMRDVLTHGKDALLFPPGDGHALRALFEIFLLCDLGELKALGAQCQTLIENDYTHTQEARRYCKLLASG